MLFLNLNVYFKVIWIFINIVVCGIKLIVLNIRGNFIEFWFFVLVIK